MARPKKIVSPNLKRIQMEMPIRSVERLKSLQEKTDSASYAEVMKNALRLYEALIKEVETGGDIVIKKDGAEIKLAVFSA